ncbi:uncharacterized protein STEHIDRAFT_151446 [Stereum hirsutum FP-91666 SS1]|uniref:uncharacterized protein n=1 Tax=Stereum hirsutum (strain FP-91666) TaxID=721885 RepID=UPI000440ED86|nr:uncharacterized protein STEHIDRAFT_151446 [Stereum hirsutum FP-91666 SS1]EIM92102.1 hypothetical protein STEHIDRAFT_151446 [Stereum hirsutum FP-91666 SS1]
MERETIGGMVSLFDKETNEETEVASRDSEILVAPMICVTAAGPGMGTDIEARNAKKCVLVVRVPSQTVAYGYGDSNSGSLIYVVQQPYEARCKHPPSQVLLLAQADCASESDSGDDHGVRFRGKMVVSLTCCGYAGSDGAETRRGVGLASVDELWQESESGIWTSSDTQVTSGDQENARDSSSRGLVDVCDNSQARVTETWSEDLCQLVETSENEAEGCIRVDGD